MVSFHYFDPKAPDLNFETINFCSDLDMNEIGHFQPGFSDFGNKNVVKFFTT